MIYKDKKYFMVYLITCIFDGILLISSIVFLIFFITQLPITPRYLLGLALLAVIFVFVFSIFGIVLGTRSLLGYLKLPYELVNIKENTITILGEENKKSDLLEIYLEIQPFSRSTKALKILFNNRCYVLKDVLEINKSYEILKNCINKE